MNAIPSGFGSMRLGRLASIRSSNVDKIIDSDEIPVRLCNYVDVYYNDRIDDHIDFQPGSALQREIDRFKLRAGDILLTKDSETPDDIAVAALVVEDFDDVICGYHLAILRPNRTIIDPTFLFWALRSKLVRESFSVRAQGITRYGLTLGGIGSVEIPFPDLATQKAIADFLDRETTRIDQLIEKKHLLMSSMEERARSSIIQSTLGPTQKFVLSAKQPICAPIIVDWDGREWHSTRLRFCVEDERNGAWGSEPGEDERDVVCIRVADFDWPNLATKEDQPTIRSISQTQYAKLMLLSGDVLLEKSGGGEKTPVGRVVRFERHTEAISSNFVARLRPVSGMDSRFLTYLFAALYMSGYSHQFIKQNTGIQNLDAGSLLSTWILAPDLGEQERIAGDLTREGARFGQLTALVDESIARLSELRSSLITTAVTGTLDISTWNKRGETARQLEAVEAAV